MPHADVEEARRTGERLRAELSTLLDALPIHQRPVSSMGRWLDVSRPVCHRVVACARTRGSGLEVLLEAPGVRGLAAFLASVRTKGIDDEIIDATEAAISAYASLVARYASRAKLTHAIRAHQSTHPHHTTTQSDDHDPTLQHPAESVGRRMVFEGARRATRRAFDCEVAVFIYGPSSLTPDTIDCATAFGLLGVQCDAGSMPICPVSRFGEDVLAGAHGDALSPLREPATRAGASVGPLEQFCSQPPPRVSIRRQGARIPLLVDPPNPHTGPFDVVLGAHFRGNPNPADNPPHMQFCRVLSDGPSRRMILVAYLHRHMANACVANSAVFAKEAVGVPTTAPDGPAGVMLPRDRWYDRLPDSPRVEYLGLGTERLTGSPYPRLTELADHLFTLGGWTPEDFVGYRISLEYPLWNTHHLLWFDFNDPAPPSQQ